MHAEGRLYDITVLLNGNNNAIECPVVPVRSLSVSDQSRLSYTHAGQMSRTRPSPSAASIFVWRKIKAFTDFTILPSQGRLC